MTCYQHNPMKRTPSSLSSACVELCEKKIQRQLKTKIQRTQTIHDKERRTKSDFNFCFFFYQPFCSKGIANSKCVVRKSSQHIHCRAHNSSLWWDFKSVNRLPQWNWAQRCLESHVEWTFFRSFYLIGA